MLASEVAICFFFIGEDQTAFGAAVTLPLIDSGLLVRMLAFDSASKGANRFNHLLDFACE
jgi:hypothetical protein